MIKTTLAKRIIPLILFRDYQVVKSIKFSKYRVVGNFEQTIKVFNIRDVDEIIILDISFIGIIIINSYILLILIYSLLPIAYKQYWLLPIAYRHICVITL